MDKKCLKTTLPTTIDNPALQVLGQFNVFNKSSVSQPINITCAVGKPFYIETPDGNSVLVNTQDSTFQYQANPGLSKIKNFYRMRSISFGFSSALFETNITTGSLKFCEDLMSISSKDHGNAKGTAISGDIKELASLTKLSILDIGGAEQSYLFGNVADLAPVTTLTTLNLYRTLGVVGKIEDLLAGMSKNGRISGNLTVTLASSAATFHDKNNAPIYAEFGSTEVNVYRNNTKDLLVGTYNVASESWTYPA